MSRFAWVAVAAIGLLATTASADDAYTLKLYQSKKGDKFAHEKSETDKMTIGIDAGGQKKDQKVTGGSKYTFTEEVLEKKAGDKRATKLSRAYTVAEKTEKGETADRPYAGKTLVIEKKGDEYEFTIKGKALTKDEAPELFRQFSARKEDEPTDQDLLPTDPIKVGANWTIPADKSEKYFKSLSADQLKVDPKKSKIEGKLLKAYKKNGVQYGVLELTLTTFVTEIDLGGVFYKTTPESKVVLKLTADTCIDGTTAFSDAKMERAIDFTADIPNVGTVTITGTSSGGHTEQAAKK